MEDCHVWVGSRAGKGPAVGLGCCESSLTTWPRVLWNYYCLPAPGWSQLFEKKDGWTATPNIDLPWGHVFIYQSAAPKLETLSSPPWRKCVYILEQKSLSGEEEGRCASCPINSSYPNFRVPILQCNLCMQKWHLALTVFAQEELGHCWNAL